MYNRPMCGRSTGTYTNLGDLQRDLMGQEEQNYIISYAFVVYLRMMSVPGKIQDSNGRLLGDELERSGHIVHQGGIQSSVWRHWKNPWKAAISMVYAPAEIQTGRHPNKGKIITTWISWLGERKVVNKGWMEEGKEKLKLHTPSNFVGKLLLVI
jgi:hypothetical protein